MSEIDTAAEKLKEASADSYINKNAVDSIAKSLFSDFEITLLISISTLILKNQPNKKDFLDQIKFIWKTRANSILKDDFQRFQELIIKQSDEKVLPDTAKDILNNYKLTLDTAMVAVEDSVNTIIETILCEKETKNER